MWYTRLMTPLPNVPNVLKARLSWTVEGDALAQTVHHFSYTGGPPSSTNCVTMANGILAAAGTAFAALMADSVALESCQVTDLSNVNDGQGVSTGSAITGTRGTELLPPGAAMVISHTISRRYRGGHPRTYLPIGISSDITTSGLWDSTIVTAANTDWASWIAAVLGVGAGCTISGLVNVSYYNGSTVYTNPVTGRARNIPTKRTDPLTDSVTGSVSRNSIGSQRRRNRDA